MGALADGALAHNGDVVGVIPESLFERDIAHSDVSELRVVASMHERKAEMARLSDAFIALPGGIGTLEELFEVWTWAHLGIQHKPIGLLNVTGFFDGLLAFADQLVEDGFFSSESRALVIDAPHVDELLARIDVAAPTGPRPRSATRR
jgi:uncharacterized protein (TIGR00730 family)